MNKLTKFSYVLTFIFIFAITSIYAQDGDEVVMTTRAVAVGSSSIDTKEEKGSTVRGRVFYQDTGKPVRHGLIGFLKIKELVEPPADKNGGKGIAPVSRSPGADKYVLTDSNGEFEIKNIKAGIYQAILKVQGVLNPSFSDRNNPEFQQFSIDGVNEVRTEVGVKRGASISGRVLYPDGDPIIGAKVQVSKKDDKNFRSSSYEKDITEEITDDRGYYRFAGLPQGEYIVRVMEKANHSNGASINGYASERFQSDADSELKTFYPNVSDVEKAEIVQVSLGQEQTGIDIIVPERQLFRISGSAVAKNTKQPLKNIDITFTKIEEGTVNYRYSSGNTSQADEQGKWLFKELPKGKYILRFAHQIPYSYSKEEKASAINQPKYASVSREIEIASENLTDINVELPIEATVSGIVTVEDNKPFPDFVSFTAADNQRKIYASGYLSNYNRDEKDKRQNPSSREFTISGLYEGNFQIGARVNNYYVKSIRLGNIDLLTSPIDIKDGDKIEGVQIVLGTDVGTIKGTVSNMPEGKRLFVVMIPSGKTGMEALQNSRSAPVAGNGSFEVKGSPGEYRIFVVDQENRPDRDKLEEWVSNLLQNSQTVSLSTNETKTINLDFPKN